MTLNDREIMALLKLKMLMREGNPSMDVFLKWCHARFEQVYHEDENLDWMQKLHHYAEAIGDIRQMLE